MVVKPNLGVEILKEVITDKDNSYDGNITFHCDVGSAKIKIVEDNYGGEFKLSQSKGSLFTYTDSKMFFDEKFSFGS